MIDSFPATPRARLALRCASARAAFGAALLVALLAASNSHAAAKNVRHVLKARRAAPARSTVAPTAVASLQGAATPVSSAMAAVTPESELGGSPAPVLELETRTDERAAAASAERAVEQQLDVKLRVQAGWVRRSLDFRQDVYRRLRELQSNVYVYRLDAELYPFRPGPLDFQIALIGGYEGAISGSVRDVDFDAEYDAAYSELFGGLRAQRSLRGHELGLELSLGRVDAGVVDAGGRAGTPDVRYTHLRTGLDFTLRFGALRPRVAAGFRVPLSYGEISSPDWFPRVGGYGIDASLGMSYFVATGISVDLSATLKRFILEMNSRAEDPAVGLAEVAGGAVDMYLGAYAGVTFAL